MLEEYITTLVGGVNNYVDAQFLDATQYPKGVNVSSRGGVLHTRPRFVKVCANIATGRFQGIYPHGDRIVAVIGGTVYSSENASDWAPVTDDNDENVEISPNVRKTWATSVYDTLMLNDGINPPAIVTATSGRFLAKQGDDFEIPASTVCTFGQGRVFFADPYRTTLMAGDIYIPGNPESAFKFTEQQYLNESLSIRQPASYGRITAMEFIRNSESGTGLGQLIVFYEGGVCAYNVSEPRNTWLDTQLGQSLFTLGGCGGSDFVLQQNNDLFFRTSDGLTTLRDTASNVSSGIRALPISMPVSNRLKRDQVWTLEYGSIAVNDNRVVFTHGLRVDTHGDYYFDSLIPMDLASFYMNGETQMTFDDVWIGPKMTKVFTGRYRGKNVLFVTSKGENNENILWRLDEDALYDGPEVRPQSRLYTKTMMFENAFLYKQFQAAEIWFDDLKTDCDVTLYFRGDSGLWQEASAGTFLVPYYASEIPDNDNVRYVLSQDRCKVRIAIQEDLCNPVNKRMLASATAFQFCIQVRGIASTPRMRFICKDVTGDNGEIHLCNSENEDILLTTDTDGTFVLYDYEEDFLV